MRRLSGPRAATVEPGLPGRWVRRSAHDLHDLKADGDDREEELERLALSASRLCLGVAGVAHQPGGHVGPDARVRPMTRARACR